MARGKHFLQIGDAGVDTPLCPAGHLPHKGGDRQGRGRCNRGRFGDAAPRSPEPASGTSSAAAEL
ncbi:hypothetical protein FKV68_12560 [Sinorhizobium mexicanum]|uniref:Lytic murein transglycosylase n=1 Tax=Sinorhizobium mexicanum TaxID=375549 RepID=A0A859QFC9_9HYPH|nr:hypothetical protein FKV68_12560 [Sinorhizobium mexicanum]